MDDGMDVSPFPSRGPSLSATPVSHSKRPRDCDNDDYMLSLADQVICRQRSGSPSAMNPLNAVNRTPCASAHGSPQRAAVHTPLAGGGAMCTTPCGMAPEGGSATLGMRLGVRWASHQRQGPRSTQEDYLLCKADERAFPHAYFGVFDGHGGQWVSEYCADHLHDNVLTSEFAAHDPLTALQDGFLRTDAQLLRRAAASRRQQDAGSAAVVAMATAEEIFLAHSGDCRAILVKRSAGGGVSGSSSSSAAARMHHAPSQLDPVTTDGSESALGGYRELTHDHTAETSKGGQHIRPDEVLRVQKAGGVVDSIGGCVTVGDGGNRSLPMTRAFGNLPLKVSANRNWRMACALEQVVTALPSVSVYAREADDLCLVLASDGLFGNVLSSERVADLARDLLEGPSAGAPDAEKQCARMLSGEAVDTGSDNVSVVVVSLLPPPEPPHRQQQQQQQQQPSAGMAGLLGGMLGGMGMPHYRQPAAASLGGMLGGGVAFPGFGAADASSAAEPFPLHLHNGLREGGAVSSAGQQQEQRRRAAQEQQMRSLLPSQPTALNRPAGSGSMQTLATLSASSRNSSLDSVDTDFASSSPGREPIREKLRLPFESAYPYVQGEGREHDEENAIPNDDTQEWNAL